VRGGRPDVHSKIGQVSRCAYDLAPEVGPQEPLPRGGDSSPFVSTLLVRATRHLESRIRANWDSYRRIEETHRKAIDQVSALGRNAVSAVTARSLSIARTIAPLGRYGLATTKMLAVPT